MSESSIDRMLPQRANALKGVLAAKPNFSSDGALSDFLSAYFLCEALANKLIEYLETDNPPMSAKSKKIKCSNCGAENECPKKKTSGHFKTLDVGKIKKALIHFSLDFPCDDTDAIFKSGNGIVGQRTARQLRNEYAHSLSLCASEEITQRSAEFLDLMMRFCTSVKNRITGRKA